MRRRRTHGHSRTPCRASPQESQANIYGTLLIVPSTKVSSALRSHRRKISTAAAKTNTIDGMILVGPVVLRQHVDSFMAIPRISPSGEEVVSSQVAFRHSLRDAPSTGIPDLFVTVTCIPKWDDFKRQLEPGHTLKDRLRPARFSRTLPQVDA